MAKIQKHIEIIRSTVSGLSSMSREDCDSIYSVLRRYYATVGISIINNVSDLNLILQKHPDLVFMGMKFVPINSTVNAINGEKIWIGDHLENLGIPYTGSAHLAQEYARDKDMAKQRTIAAGLKTAAFCVIDKKDQAVEAEINLSYPVFIKPTNRGGGLGIDINSLAYDFKALRSKVQSLSANLGSDSMIEEYLPGREFSVAIIRQVGTNKLLTMPIEITAPLNQKGSSFLTEFVKQSDTEKVSIVQDSELKRVLNKLAEAVFTALGARDYGRIDMKLDACGVPSFIEANFLPGLSNHGYMARCFRLNAGIVYEGMILHIVSLALERIETINELRAGIDISGIFGPVVAVKTR